METNSYGDNWDNLGRQLRQFRETIEEFVENRRSCKNIGWTELLAVFGLKGIGITRGWNISPQISGYVTTPTVL